MPGADNWIEAGGQVEKKPASVAAEELEMVAVMMDEPGSWAVAAPFSSIDTDAGRLRGAAGQMCLLRQVIVVGGGVATVRIGPGPRKLEPITLFWEMHEVPSTTPAGVGTGVPMVSLGQQSVPMPAPLLVTLQSGVLGPRVTPVVTGWT